MRPAPRIVLYGRHSTAMQTVTSSIDQTESCMKLVTYVGGTVMATYHDPEQSGYRRDRPGLRKLLADIESGTVDLIVCEALDRLARDAEDVAWLGKKLAYHRVQLHTVSEGHVDEIKFAVAGLLGAIFLKHLIDKTLRGMEAAVLAGRCAGGRSYGYKRVIRLDDRGERIRGLLEIDEAQAAIVERIFTEFAAGASSIQIATKLNTDGVPGPRGGQWNASTVRGDPKKATGILNNPLYVGRLVWGRRQWRRNPDSEKRERRYRLREHSEWIEVAVPDLRIVDDAQWSAVQTQIEQRSRPSTDIPVARQNRRKHLLSGLIRCSCCGSGYTISGKDYYRCAGQKERGTCSNTVSVRKGPLETATLSILQQQLLTEDHARLFADEFRREMVRLTSTSARQDQSIIDHLAVVTREIDTLAANMLAAVASPALLKLLGDREAEKARLEAQLNTPTAVAPSATILSPPAVQQLFKEKVGRLREALDAETVRGEAAEILSTLIESVTIYPDGRDGPEAEVVAKVADLVAFATNDNAAREGGMSSSMKLVAGTGFEPVTFRL
ncbi:recombinase family protein [Sphingomonas sp. Leaf208]|uniref:recombinase family protein n=1 Tax=Sphingomonas sp. Leaf208 TaxID=1735679 RepID=UPI00138F8294|nr:recombinase family protein [Sphingomonas sp. Leaf208]